MLLIYTLLLQANYCHLLWDRRARSNARSDLGALNAGRAWIFGGGAVDGFEQCLLFQFSGVCASRAFLFLSVSSDLRTNAGIGRKVTFDFYNLKNISWAGLVSGRSLIDKLRFIVASDVILRSIFPLLWRSPLPSARKARILGRLIWSIEGPRSE